MLLWGRHSCLPRRMAVQRRPAPYDWYLNPPQRSSVVAADTVLYPTELIHCEARHMAIPMHYETSCQWNGEGEGGSLAVPGLDPLTVGMPAEGTEQETWTPEHMMLAAMEACLLNTFTVIGGMSKLVVGAYESTAEGELDFEKGQGYKFARMTIRPVVTVSEDMLAKAEDVLERAHKFCLITRSVNFPVDIEPEFVVA
jgi:organic hydroperoxide reductase OsmC/OhrA